MKTLRDYFVLALRSGHLVEGFDLNRNQMEWLAANGMATDSFEGVPIVERRGSDGCYITRRSFRGAKSVRVSVPFSTLD